MDNIYSDSFLNALVGFSGTTQTTSPSPPVLSCNQGTCILYTTMDYVILYTLFYKNKALFLGQSVL